MMDIPAVCFSVIKFAVLEYLSGLINYVNNNWEKTSDIIVISLFPSQQDKEIPVKEAKALDSHKGTNAGWLPWQALISYRPALFLELGKLV